MPIFEGGEGLEFFLECARLYEQKNSGKIIDLYGDPRIADKAPVHVIGTRMVQAMFTEFKVGDATAIAVLLFIMVFFGTTATLRAIRREQVEFYSV